MDLYLMMVVSVLFPAGCFIIVVIFVNNPRSARTLASIGRGHAPAKRRKQTIVNPTGNLERILASAIVIHWDDLTRGTHALIHMEYGLAGATPDDLKAWPPSGRGHWRLACGCCMSECTSHGAGGGYKNGYKGEGLMHILEIAM